MGCSRDRFLSFLTQSSDRKRKLKWDLMLTKATDSNVGLCSI